MASQPRVSPITTDHWSAATARRLRLADWPLQGWPASSIGLSYAAFASRYANRAAADNPDRDTSVHAGQGSIQGANGWQAPPIDNEHGAGQQGGPDQSSARGGRPKVAGGVKEAKSYHRHAQGAEPIT